MQVVMESGALNDRSLLAGDIHTYRLADELTEALIYFMVVFGPWAFGTTEPWSIWTLNAGGYVLGVLLLIKLNIRSVKGYRPRRWGSEMGKAESTNARKRENGDAATLRPTITGHASRSALLTDRTTRLALTPTLLTRVLGVIAFALLSYCLIAALNPRATFDSASLTLVYHDYLRWLPHSFDSRNTWEAFWKYLALACSFWAICDWLPGKSVAEERADRACATRQQRRVSEVLLPARLSRLLLVLAISGGLLGLEGIVQRLSGSPRLLFLVKPQIHQTAQTQFASYAYRANGAQYFNLVWPVCLGFWWRIHRAKGAKPIAKHLLLASSLTMAACPLVSSARGAALVELGMILSATAGLLIFLCFVDTHRAVRTRTYSATLVLLFVTGTLALGLGLGWKDLRLRMEGFKDSLENREQICARAGLIARDYPIFGTGPGTFEPVFQLYRVSPEAYWPAQLHNDWLETRVTFGWVGCGLLTLGLLTIFLRWFVPGGIHAGRRFVFLVWLAQAGCLVEARWDFPMQVYSILFVFLVWCAVLFTLSRQP
jgi:hypothetical protein